MEIDHYMWAILNATSNSEVDEVILDTEANWKAVSKHNIKVFIQNNFVILFII